jgi:hypothetical protein
MYQQTCAPACHPCRSNVLLSREGRASLADLGVSQVLLSSARSAEGLSLLYAGKAGQTRGLRILCVCVCACACCFVLCCVVL